MASETKQEDKELADILESALRDFSEEPVEKASTSKTDENKENKEVQIKSDEPEKEWSAEFIKEAALKFESNIANILQQGDVSAISPEDIQKQFQSMADAATKLMGSNADDFASTISRTLQDLSEGTENLQQATQDEGQNQNIFLPFMHGVMQSLLSKEVLYPSLKDILDQYPQWLESSKDKLKPEELHNYEEQQKLMRTVCQELETETTDDSTAVKQERFERVLALMQKLQDYGQPPQELVGNLGSELPFNMGDMDPSQCALM